MKNSNFSLFFLLAAVILVVNESPAQWTQVEKSHLYPQVLVTVGINVFAGFNGLDLGNGGIFLSSDNGETWSAADSGLVKYGWDTLSILNLAATGDTLVAGTNKDGIFVSTNNGNNWNQMNNGIGDSANQPLHIMAVGAEDSKLYAAVTFTGIFVSSDAGQNWKIIDNGLPLNYLGGLAGISVNAFCFVGQYIYLACLPKSYVSENGGASWMPSTGDSISSVSGYCFASIGNVIFMGTGSNSYGNPPVLLLRSSVGGNSWKDISGPYKNVSGSAEIYSLAAYKNYLIAGSRSGVYVSSDSGATWTSINEGWEYQLISVNALTVSNNYLFAGTNGYGIWRMPLSQFKLTGIEEQKGTIPVIYNLNQNYPNPFNPATTISYSIPRESFVTLKIYDALGRQVTSLVEKKESPGKYSVEFNASKLSSGVYFYRLNALTYGKHSREIVQTRKMLLLK